MTNRQYKQDIKEVFNKRIKQGDSMHDIAMSLDVDKATVSRWAKKYNIKTNNKFPRGDK